MIEWLKNLIFGKKPYTVVLRKEYNDWTDDDRRFLSGFVHSLSGRKFIYLSEQSVHNLALDPRPRNDYDDGIRVGMVMVLNRLKEYSVTAPDQVTEVNEYGLHADTVTYQ